MTQPESPLVSVIIPAYNEVSFIEEALTSVFAQTYSPIELIVVDDGSTDGTVGKILEYDKKLELIKTSHKGASHARNVGALSGKGKYLVFLDADDVMGQTAIEGLVDAQMSVESSDVISVCEWKYLMQDETDRWVEKVAPSSFDPNSRDPLEAWLSGKFYPPCALMWPRKLFEKIGGWDETLSRNQDGDLVMRALVNGAEVVRSDIGRGYYRRYHDRTRISHRRDQEAFEAQWKVLRRVENNLEKIDRLNKYSAAIGRAYHRSAKIFFPADRDLARRCERRGLKLGGRASVAGDCWYRVMYRLLGLEWAIRIGQQFRDAVRRLIPRL